MLDLEKIAEDLKDCKKCGTTPTCTRIGRDQECFIYCPRCSQSVKHQNPKTAQKLWNQAQEDISTEKKGYYYS